MTDEFLWRKQVFPFGAIPWRGRELNFTPAYLGDMAEAFADGALEVVPLSAESDRGGFSGDPTLIRGEVRSLEVVSDGLDALAEVDAETDALLEADPEYPAAAQVIEHYRAAGTHPFPVVMRGLYLTRSPAITGLRPWTRET